MSVDLTFGTWEERPFCLNGWSGGGRHKPSCNYTGGHFCDREYLHKGKCRCVCGSTSSTVPPLIDEETTCVMCGGADQSDPIHEVCVPW